MSLRVSGGNFPHIQMNLFITISKAIKWYSISILHQNPIAFMTLFSSESAVIRAQK